MSHFKKESFNKLIILFIFLSIVLELSHNLIPSRSFQFLDLFGNLFGTVMAILVIFSYKKYIK